MFTQQDITESVQIAAGRLVQVTEEAKSLNCADKLFAMHLLSISTQLAWIISATFVVVFMQCAQVEAYLGSTAFVTSVTTVTVTSTSQNLCGKLVNVTGACRRRRNFKFEKPEIQLFGGDYDETIELAFPNAYYRNQFVPTKTLSMEVTPLVMLPQPISSGRNPSIVSHHPGLHSSHPMYSFIGSRSKSPYLHPSLYQDQVKLQQQQQQRIFFSALSLANLFGRTTVTYTTFRTETKTEVKSGTGSFIVVSCTPSPFPFSVCNAKAPLPITITPVG